MNHIAIVTLVALILVSAAASPTPLSAPPPPSFVRDSKYGIKVKLPKVMSWNTTLQQLRMISCVHVGYVNMAVNCVAGYATNHDFVPTSTTASDEFTVAVAEPWVVYNGIGAPQAVLDAYNITAIGSAHPLPEITARGGKHLVTAVMKNCEIESSNTQLSAWAPWGSYSFSMGVMFARDTSTVELLNSTSSFNATTRCYHTTVVVSTRSLSLQIEIVSVDYSTFVGLGKAWSYSFGNIINASLFPPGLTVDDITKSYGNRVQFEFIRPFYLTFNDFTQQLSSVFDIEANMNVTESSMTLVEGNSFVKSASDNYQWEIFTVSFETTNQQQKIIAISKLKDGMAPFWDGVFGGSFINISTVPSRGPTNPPTPIPEPWGEGYVLADLFSSTKCLGPPMPAAINAGCVDGAMLMCMDDQTIKRRAYSQNSCGGAHSDSTIELHTCIPAPVSVGMNLFMLVRSCAPLGAVPRQKATYGACVDTFNQGDCTKVKTSVCYENDVCVRSGSSFSSMYTCSNSDDNEEYYNKSTWRTSSCKGRHNTSTFVETNNCEGKFKVWYCNAPTPVTPDPTPSPNSNDGDDDLKSTLEIILSLIGPVLFLLGAVVGSWQQYKKRRREESSSWEVPLNDDGDLSGDDDCNHGELLPEDKVATTSSCDVTHSNLVR